VFQWQKMIFTFNIFSDGRSARSSPLKTGNHWAVGVLDVPRKELAFYDSLLPGNRELNSGEREISAGFQKYLQAKHPQNYSGWKWNVTPPSPKQTNGYDCGERQCQ